MNPTLFLVTGGAGFLGINLCRHLLSRGRDVRSLDIAAFDYPERERVDIIRGDIRDRNVVDRAMADVATVVHCAAALPLSDPADILSTGEEGTRILLDSAIAHGVARFVFISSTAVYGIPAHCPIHESERLVGVGPYGSAKIKAEQLCEAFRDRGLCIPVLRPKTFVGPERLGVFELLYDWAYEGRGFPVLGSGGNRYQLLDVEDLCRAIELCVAGPNDVVNDTFNVGAAEFGTMRENVQAVLDRAGHGKRVIALPAWPTVPLLALLDRLGLSPLYPWVYRTVAKESYVSIDRIATRIGFAPVFSSRAALIRNYEWYVAHRDAVRGHWGVSHRVPWKRGILSVAKHFF
ncbi:MAG: NAD-dependent epimerase/dehydratase family protein [Burkholderiales bacterium]